MTIGDGIIFATCVWFIAWLLAKVFPTVFGGGVEDWVAMQKAEIQRKSEQIAKRRHDEMERRKATTLDPNKNPRVGS